MKRRRLRVKPRFIALVALVLSTYFVTNYALLSWRLMGMHEEIARLEQRKQAMLADQEALKQEIEALHTPAYIEQLAREQLGLIRAGEIPYYTVEETGN